MIEVSKAIAKKNNAEYWDLIRVFKEEKNSEINFYDNLHYSSTGQRKVARAMANMGSDQIGTPFEERFEIVNQILKKDHSQLYETADGFFDFISLRKPKHLKCLFWC